MKFRKSVFRNMVMISQVGISIMTPVFLCAYIGSWLDKVLGTRWLILPMLILGVLSGGRCAWQLVMRAMAEERRENEKIHREYMASVHERTGAVKPKQPSRIGGGQVSAAVQTETGAAQQQKAACAENTEKENDGCCTG